MDDDEKRYSTSLSQAEVDGYWAEIGMTQEAWMKMTESARVRTAWNDMQARLKASREATRRALEQSQEQGGR